MTQDRKQRRKYTDEFFTSKNFIADYYKFKDFENKNALIVEPSAGDGRWLEPLSSVSNLEKYAVDFVLENCIEIIENLYGPGEIKTLTPKEQNEVGLYGLKHMFTHNSNLVLNVFCADSSKFSVLKFLELTEHETFNERFNNLFEEII